MEYLSIITDGMAQHHCCLPWSANITTSKTLPHHIQGVMTHGRMIKMYRTFHNIGNGLESTYIYLLENYLLVS